MHALELLHINQHTKVEVLYRFQRYDWGKISNEIGTRDFDHAPLETICHSNATIWHSLLVYKIWRL